MTEKPFCPLRKDAAACIRRQSWTPQPRDCKVCDFYGRKGAEETRAAADVTKPAVPETIRPKPETIIPKKETPVATDKKDAIFKRIENEKRCTKSRLINFCGASADQVAEATKVLEEEGKIKAHPGIREGSVIYTLPGIPKNYDPGAPSIDATVPSKPPRRVNRKAPAAKAGPPAPSVPRNSGAKPATRPPGNGVYAAAIADLEARRTVALDQVEKFDRALETLRALA